MLKALLSSLFCLLLMMPFPAEAIGNKPEPFQGDEAALLGLYASSGIGFVVRENNGQLELLYPDVRSSGDEAKAGKNGLLPLQKEHYDAYTLQKTKSPFFEGDSLIFERDNQGRGASAKIGETNFNRRFVDGEIDKPFRLKLPKPLKELRVEAKKAPVPKKPYKMTATLVELQSVVPDLHYDLRYTTDNNLFGAALVVSKNAYLDKEAAQALGKVQAGLKEYGCGLIVWEAYRSWEDFKVATLALGDKNKSMLPKAEEGYSHNTGRAIDVSLYDLETGEPIAMICDFDQITPAQYGDYLGGTSLQRWYRDLLKEQMTAQGFTQSKDEWWHFDYNSKVPYQILNVVVK